MGSIPVANPSPPSRLALPRRGLRIAVVLFAIVIAIVVAVAFAWPTGLNVDQAGLFTAGSTSDFAINEPVRFPNQRFWLVRLESGEFAALLSRDPRSACSVPWRSDFVFAGIEGWFRDPCLGSTYDVAGKLAFGPSPRNLDRYEVRVEGGQVRVNVKTVIQEPGGPLPESPTQIPLPEVR